MDLMNKDLSKLTKDLVLNPVSAFKQDPKLVAAIDKLWRQQVASLTGDDGRMLLPQRKLDFTEVQNMIKETAKPQVTDKPAEILMKEANDARKSLMKKVEDILGDINTSAEHGDTPKIIIRNQSLWSNCIYDLDRVTLKSFNNAKKTIVTYSSSQDKTRFNTIVFVLTKVHELLSKNLTVTRRELFYQNVIRLRSQSNLDVAVRDVCCLLETPPWSLGIVATAKGLIAGILTMHHRDGSVTDCMTTGDAIFQKLLDEGALVRLAPVIIITGKGYPDVCTRQLLCRLCNEQKLRALALAQSHLSSSLACSSLLLLGARHYDVMTLASNEARLPLSDLDKRKLNSLLKRPYLLNAVVKAEIEALAPTTAALCDAYLPAKIIRAEYLGI
ncbi:Meiotic recombination protein spo11 [Operophtera brumata]|uniref:DNA topoisomerase (ATP-hydrolyzing) n=1 Tax=Operophtera brumata TaxID=104452 RepID=A0A0L7L458_OPEBR|nr:Meiotic recombination protein spo11 [Operophtera brumata]